MEKLNYSKPQIRVQKSSLRASILAGSNGGVKSGSVTGENIPFHAAKERTISTAVD